MKRQGKVFTNKTDIYSLKIAADQAIISQLAFAKQIYISFYNNERYVSFNSYVSQITSMFPQYGKMYLRNLFYLYRRIVIEAGINEFELIDVRRIEYLLIIASFNTKVIDKYAIIEIVNKLRDPSLSRKEKRAFIWKIRDKRISLERLFKNRAEFDAQFVARVLQTR